MRYSTPRPVPWAPQAARHDDAERLRASRAQHRRRTLRESEQLALQLLQAQRAMLGGVEGDEGEGEGEEEGGDGVGEGGGVGGGDAAHDGGDLDALDPLTV